MNYRAILPKDKLHYFNHLSSLLKRWIELDLAGVNPDVLQFFNSVTLPGNEKGAAVRQSCPYKGPFTDIELQAIVESAREAHRLGRLRLDDYAILLILVATGCRPGQISMLISTDIEPPSLGSTAWRLKVPSLKKRTSKRLTRERPIPNELALLLQTQARRAAADRRLREFELSTRPLFIAPALSFEDLSMAHIGPEGVRDSLDQMAAAISVRSERTGKFIPLSPVRFRRTFGTRAVEEGYAPLVVAEMLDHADLQNVGVYVENRSTIVDRIDLALATKLGPLTKLFLGTVIRTESEAAVEDPISRRVGTAHDLPVGTCGGPSSCAKRAPIACYTCASFLPWKDAPHQRLLQFLIEERERLLSSGLDPRIAAVNDTAILAIADVIGRCKAQPGDAAYG